MEATKYDIIDIRDGSIVGTKKTKENGRTAVGACDYLASHSSPHLSCVPRV